MPQSKPKYTGPTLTREWQLPPAATLGSSVRAKGVLLEIRARLPAAVRRSLDVRGSLLVLNMPEDDDVQFAKTAAAIDHALIGIESLEVIPREIEDILTIKTSERHRWLKDGRLPSAGTRTVKLRGRARKITFHVFDPRFVEGLLDGELIDQWREEDVATAAENRRRAAWKAKLARARKTEASSEKASFDNPGLVGWEEFEREFLR